MFIFRYILATIFSLFAFYVLEQFTLAYWEASYRMPHAAGYSRRLDFCLVALLLCLGGWMVRKLLNWPR